MTPQESRSLAHNGSGFLFCYTTDGDTDRETYGWIRLDTTM